MADNKGPEIAISKGNTEDKSGKEKTVKVLVLESRALLYGNEIITIKKGETIEVTQNLKDRLVACKSVKVL